MKHKEDEWQTEDYKKLLKERLEKPYDFSGHTKLFLSLAEIQPGQKVLDLGCGVGHISYYFAKSGADVLGIDVSESALKLANKFYKLQNLNFMLQDCLDIDFKEEFDILYSAGESQM